MKRQTPKPADAAHARKQGRAQTARPRPGTPTSAPPDRGCDRGRRHSRVHGRDRGRSRMLRDRGRAHGRGRMRCDRAHGRGRSTPRPRRPAFSFPLSYVPYPFDNICSFIHISTKRISRAAYSDICSRPIR